MCDLLRYFTFYAATGLGLVCPPQINPDDPLENSGPLQVERIPETVPFDYNGDSMGLEAELFTPIDQQPDAFVLFMPGFGATYQSYEIYLEHFASHGFLAVGLNFASSGFCATDGEHNVKAFQALDTISYLKLMYPEYDNLPVITAGHSLGGKIAFYASALDTTIASVMALDPSNAGGPPCFLFPEQCIRYPVAPNPKTEQEGNLQDMGSSTSSLIARSAPDPLTNPDAQFNADNFYFGTDGNGSLATPSPVWYYDFGVFPHGLYLPNLPSKQIQIIKRTMLAFLMQEVRGADMENYLTGEIIQADIDKDRLVSVESR